MGIYKATVAGVGSASAPVNTQASDNVVMPEPDMTVADPQPINMPPP